MTLSTDDRTEKKKETVEIIAHVAKSKDDKKKKKQWLQTPFCTVLGIVKSTEDVNLHKKN